MMQEEIFDIVNENDEVIGQAPRAHVHQMGLLHRAVHIWIYNQKGEVLLQKRSQTKDRFPGRWTSSVCGHVDSGETYEEAAPREIAEEIGLKNPLPLKEIGYFAASSETENEFIRLYASRSEGPFQTPPEEVDQLLWISPEKLFQWIESDPEQFTPSLIHLWKTIYQS